MGFNTPSVKSEDDSKSVPDAESQSRRTLHYHLPVTIVPEYDVGELAMKGCITDSR
jgi:hypothetical protein